MEDYSQLANSKRDVHFHPSRVVRFEETLENQSILAAQLLTIYPEPETGSNTLPKKKKKEECSNKKQGEVDVAILN